MATITKKELVDRIAEQTDNKRVVVKQIIQSFLNHIVDALGNGNRLEFRDFGVFESKERAAGGFGCTGGQWEQSGGYVRSAISRV